MTTTESARQEIELKFAGQSYFVRPSFQCIVGIESQTNQASRSLGMKMLSAEASVVEVAMVLQVILKAEPLPPGKALMSPADIGDQLMEDGYGDLLLPLGLYLTRAQRGNKEHEKEAAKEAARIAAAAAAGDGGGAEVEDPLQA